MRKTVLEPASEQEAEMALAAQRCIEMALDHSKAEFISLKLDHRGAKTKAPELKLPPRALRFLADVLRQMAKREPMVLVPQHHEMSTQEAANFLSVSRPFVIKEIDAGRLKCRLVNRHRRIAFSELVRYQEEQKKTTSRALDEMADISRKLKLDL